jgi:hypothetical protein
MAQERKSQLSEKLTPKAILEGEVKKFRLLNAGRIDPLSDQPAFNAGGIFTGTTTIYDSGSKRPVMIKNVVSESIIEDKATGTQRTQEIIEDVEFDGSGMCYVKHTEPEKYLFLCRHNACKTNPFRDKAVPAIWEEIIQVNIKEAERFNIDLEYDALTTVKGLDAKEIIALAESLSEKQLIKVNVNGNISDVRLEIEKYCKINASEVIRSSKNPLPKIKLDIQDAIAIKEIEFMAEKNEWQWVNKFGKDKSILSITPGHDPVAELAKHLLDEEKANNEAPADKKNKTTLKLIKDTLKELPV